MGRKKVRKFESKEHYEEVFDKYFRERRLEVIGHLMDSLGYDDFEKLRSDEVNMKWGFDCGWILIYPRDDVMRHEWELDNGKYSAYIFAHPSYYPQSTTLQRIQVDKAIKDLGLSDMFFAVTKLD